MERHTIGPDGISFKQNGQANWLHGIWKYKERGTDLKIRDERKEDHYHFQQSSWSMLPLAFGTRKKEVIN